MSKKTTRGILLPCPRCGEPNASIGVNLADIDAEDALTCHKCEAVFSVDDLLEIMARWPVALSWLDSIPRPGRTSSRHQATA
jgi:hypothetical protein